MKRRKGEENLYKEGIGLSNTWGGRRRALNPGGIREGKAFRHLKEGGSGLSCN